MNTVWAYLAGLGTLPLLGTLGFFAFLIFDARNPPKRE